MIMISDERAERIDAVIAAAEKVQAAHYDKVPTHHAVSDLAWAVLQLQLDSGRRP